MPMKNERMSGPVPELEASFKKDRHSLKKFLDRSRFSPRLLLFTRLSKSVECDSIKPGISETNSKPTFNHPAVPVTCLCSNGPREQNMMPTASSIPAAVMSFCPSSKRSTPVESGSGSTAVGEPIVEEEYEESLSHFADVILENLRTGCGPNIKISPDGVSELSLTGRALSYLTLPPNCLANWECAPIVSNSEAVHAVCCDSPHRNSSASSERINPCAIYNEPCDAKLPTGDVVDGPTMIYTMSDLAQELNDVSVNLESSSKNSAQSSVTLPKAEPLQPELGNKLTANTACDQFVCPSELFNSSEAVSKLSPVNNAKLFTTSTSISVDTQPSPGFGASPRGNSVIVHHPTSPFARVPRFLPDASSFNQNNVLSSHIELTNTTTSSTKLVTSCPSVMSNETPSGTEMSIKDAHLKDSRCPSHTLSKQPCNPDQPRSDTQATYEEAWDLKMARQLGFGIPRLTATPHTLAKNELTSGQVPTLISSCLPDDLIHEQLNLHSTPASSQFAAVEDNPNRNDSAKTPVIPISTQADGIANSSPLSHANRLFEERPVKKAACYNQPHLSTPTFSEYDYAYNGSWCMGVKLNLSLAMDNVSKSEPSPTFPDTHQSVDAPLHLVAPAVPAHQHRTGMKDHSTRRRILSSPSDMDAASTDSYDDSWDKKHDQAMSELTSSRFMSPSSMLPSISSPSSYLANPSQVQRLVSHVDQVANGSMRMVSETRCTSRNGLSSTPNILSSQLEALPLEEQLWYHPSLTRSEAEALLSCEPEGSFLVRNSETCVNDYSLTIKHKTFLHMKISRNHSGQFILGEYSQPYASVPQMIYHYSRTSVPVRGADCVTLTHPVCRRTG